MTFRPGSQRVAGIARAAPRPPHSARRRVDLGAGDTGNDQFREQIILQVSWGWLDVLSRAGSHVCVLINFSRHIVSFACPGDDCRGAIRCCSARSAPLTATCLDRVGRTSCPDASCYDLVLSLLGYSQRDQSKSIPISTNSLIWLTNASWGYDFVNHPGFHWTSLPNRASLRLRPTIRACLGESRRWVGSKT